MKMSREMDMAKPFAKRLPVSSRALVRGARCLCRGGGAGAEYVPRQLRHRQRGGRTSVVSPCGKTLAATMAVAPGPAVSQFSSAEASCVPSSDVLPRLFGPAWRGLSCGVGVAESLNYSERAKLRSNDCCPAALLALRRVGCGRAGRLRSRLLTSSTAQARIDLPVVRGSCGVEARSRLSPGVAWRVGSGWESPSFHVARWVELTLFCAA